MLQFLFINNQKGHCKVIIQLGKLRIPKKKQFVKMFAIAIQNKNNINSSTMSCVVQLLFVYTFFFWFYWGYHIFFSMFFFIGVDLGNINISLT